MRRSGLVVLLAAALWATGCTRLPGTSGATGDALVPNGTVVDGYRVGSLLDCQTGCDDALSFAQESAIKERGLDPSAISDVHVYAPFIPEGMRSTGGSYIVVYDLPDSAQMAIGVHCGVGPCQVIPPQDLIFTAPVDYSCKDGECIRCEGSVCTPWTPPSEEPEPTPTGVPEGAERAG
jgi:hypothetical protein